MQSGAMSGIAAARPNSYNRGMPTKSTRRSSNPTHYVWRKLSGAQWEDAWWDRLAGVRDRLAITSLAGAKTIRLEAFQLAKGQADLLKKNFGGSVAVQKAPQAVSAAVRAPIRVRGKLVVVGSKAEQGTLTEKGGAGQLLLIPAGMAFGTGDHATTSTCLRFLADISEELAGENWEILDLGCGSGILAIAARRLGARRAEAGDFDPHAVRTAKENVQLNGLDKVSVKKLDVRTWHPPRTWPVIAANLFSGLLVEVAPKIAAAVAPGGHLVFSGILRVQEKEVLTAFRKAGLKIGTIVRKGKWVSGRARK
jgi:ribosomal protein L11 methyltransferase